MTDYLTRVKKLSLSGQFEEALSLILITENDNSELIRNEFEHQYLKIQVMIRKGDYEESIKEIKSILHKYQPDSLFYIDLSLFLIEATWRLGKHDSALEIGSEIELSLQEVQTSEADNLQRKAALHYHKGVIYRNLGDLDQSLTLANQSLILQQSNNLIHESAITLNLLGIIFFQKGEYDKALECY
ncbi:MAG: tetratricopeptide repeat protein, partial [Candidatus Kariarchaeaceae archaeon]